jgi:aminoglycoside phosphotransferase (APT) family kinase protein
MQPAELHAVAAALDAPVLGTTTLAGGYSHETCLLTLPGRRVVARLGGTDARIEAAVMAAAGRYVPVPRVIAVLDTATRPVMLVEHVDGRPLSHALVDGSDLGRLGAEVGRVVAAIGTVTFDRPGFFADERLTVRPRLPWSAQLPEFAARCMATTSRLAEPVRRRWTRLCTEHAPALDAIESQARLAHGDVNPKNVLVTRTTPAGG